MTQTAFRAMGAEWEVHGPGGHPAWAAAVDAVTRRARGAHARFTRFEATSELSRVNASAGEWVAVSAPFAELLRLALAAAFRTEGRFDPTVHDALVAAGYDRDLDEVLAGARGRIHAAVPCGRWPEVELRGRRLRLPAGVHVDLGGIAKGWTADRAAGDALAAGLPWALVNAGGDLRLAGDAPPYDVRIEDPEDPEAAAALVTMTGGGLATSSVTKRAWAPGVHHLIDPRTGAPATTGVLQASAWAPTAADAEVLATDALLAGLEAAERSPVVLVMDHGDVIVSLPEAMAA